MGEQKKKIQGEIKLWVAAMSNNKVIKECKILYDLVRKKKVLKVHIKETEYILLRTDIFISNHFTCYTRLLC